MSRFFKVLSVVAIALIMGISVPVSAAAECVIAKNLTAKTNRLFEVNIGFSSSRTITAARFRLAYNKNDVAFRQVTCALGRAKVSYNDKSGATDVIFLCSDGINLIEVPTLFTVKYKKLTDKDTDINIKASDCVDKNLNNFMPPKSAVCRVKGVLGSSSRVGSSGKPKRGGSYYSGKSNNSGGIDGGILETSGKNGYADTDEEVKFTGDEDPEYLKFIPIIMIIILLAFFGLVLYQNIQLKRSEKRSEEENEQ